MKSNMLFRIVCAVMLSAAMLLMPERSNAQDTALLDRMCADFADSCAELECAWSMRLSGASTKGSGNMRIQDNMWFLSGNGVEMWCDGNSTWILDMSLKEAVIEPVEEEMEYISNPALIFARLPELFLVNTSHPTKDGKAVFYGMRPKTDSTIDFLDVEINSSDASMRRGTVAMKSGDVINIEVSSMELTPKVSVEAFRPRDIFDSSWIVTDLR